MRTFYALIYVYFYGWFMCVYMCIVYACECVPRENSKNIYCEWE